MAKSKEKSIRIGLCGAILFLFLVVIPSASMAADLLQAGQGAPRTGTFFDIPTSIRLLEEVEQCRILEEESRILREYNENLLQSEKIRENRISELEQSQENLKSLSDEAVKNAEMARKSAGGTWYSKAYNAGKWIAIGILVGVVVGGGR